MQRDRLLPGSWERLQSWEAQMKVRLVQKQFEAIDRMDTRAVIKWEKRLGDLLAPVGPR